MTLGKAGFAAIKSVGSEWRSDVHPFVEILRQDQVASGAILWQITRPGLRLCAAASERLYEEGCRDYAAHNQCGHCQKFLRHRWFSLRTADTWEPTASSEQIMAGTVSHLTLARAPPLPPPLPAFAHHQRPTPTSGS